MWNRLSLRARVTLLSALCLGVVCVVLTVLLVGNANRTYATPYAQLVETLPAQPVMDVAMPVSPVVATRMYELGVASTASAAYTQAQSTNAHQSYWYMAGILLAGVALIWWISGRTLAPVRALKTQIEAVDEGNLSEPLPVPGRQDEVAALTRSFNSMLAKVGKAYEGQKRFAQNAAHELRTPISAILTNLEVLAINGETDPLEVQETLCIVRADALRMAALIEDMLSLGAAVSPDRTETFAFSDILEDILADHQAEMDQKKIVLLLSGNLSLSGDRPLLTHAFANILQNAIRYNVRGGQIRITCMQGGVTVSDTGIGIPREAIDRVFEPFYCVDVSRSRMLGGSGLGLSIARQIFERHGMRIAIASETGTTVTVFTPRSPDS